MCVFPDSTWAICDFTGHSIEHHQSFDSIVFQAYRLNLQSEIWNIRKFDAILSMLKDFTDHPIFKVSGHVFRYLKKYPPSLL